MKVRALDFTNALSVGEKFGQPKSVIYFFIYNTVVYNMWLQIQHRDFMHCNTHEYAIAEFVHP